MNLYDRCIEALQERVDEYDRLYRVYVNAEESELMAFARVRASAWAAAVMVVQDLKHNQGEDPRKSKGGVMDTNISVQLSTNDVGEVVGINVLGGLFGAVEPAEFDGVTGISFLTDDALAVIVELEAAIAQLRGIGAATS